MIELYQVGLLFALVLLLLFCATCIIHRHYNLRTGKQAGYCEFLWLRVIICNGSVFVEDDYHVQYHHQVRIGASPATGDGTAVVNVQEADDFIVVGTVSFPNTGPWYLASLQHQQHGHQQLNSDPAYVGEIDTPNGPFGTEHQTGHDAAERGQIFAASTAPFSEHIEGSGVLVAHSPPMPPDEFVWVERPVLAIMLETQSQNRRSGGGRGARRHNYHHGRMWRNGEVPIASPIAYDPTSLLAVPTQPPLPYGSGGYVNDEYCDKAEDETCDSDIDHESVSSGTSKVFSVSPRCRSLDSSVLSEIVVSGGETKTTTIFVK